MPSPQQDTAPVLRSAHVKFSPAATSVASVRPTTATGSSRCVVVPSPS
ncbi:MAG: hypothetical protein M5U28_02425 [Sandaracinaceae bacterium]|nr:hypothetical protein [Sandaracinaceae bacterium]